MTGQDEQEGWQVRIAVSRSGGIAGMIRRGVLDVDAVDDPDAWLPLAELAAAGPPVPVDPAVRDAYVWTIEVDDVRTVVPDSALPYDLRELAERTLDEGSLGRDGGQGSGLENV